MYTFLSPIKPHSPGDEDVGSDIYYWQDVYAENLVLKAAGSEPYNPSAHDSVGTVKMFPYASSTSSRYSQTLLSEWEGAL